MAQVDNFPNGFIYGVMFVKNTQIKTKKNNAENRLLRVCNCRRHKSNGLAGGIGKKSNSESTQQNRC